VVPIGIWVAFVKGRTITCTRIADGKTTLTIPSDAAAAKIQAHLSGGNRAQRPAMAAGMSA
jgi:hypothetical protein